MNPGLELADRIVAVLNNQNADYPVSFPIGFTAERLAAPLAPDQLEKLNELKVSVFAGPTSAERQTRSEYRRTYKPAIVLQSKLFGLSPAQNLAQSDELVELVGLIEKRFEDVDFDDMEPKPLSFDGFDEEQDRDLYNIQMLRDMNFFATAIVLTYVDG